ncbi:hypothetical protein SDC9_118808 [bioreactor metagenome]|uniref:Bro-N domain-containing protein n=1 Tax=bioreactor metagenome TaxID=1076179 RepID=A0A645C3Q3_9ZZZZ
MVMNDTKQNGSNLPAVFSYGETNKLVAVEKDGQYWFIARDICSVLGLKEPHRVVSKLDDDERQILTGVDSTGRKSEMIAVNESGMYALIMRSNKPEAKAFRKWVTGTVLPELRKSGSYEVKSDQPKITGMDIRYRVQQRFAAASKLSGSISEMCRRVGISASMGSHIMNPAMWNQISAETWLMVDRKCSYMVESINVVDALARASQIDDPILRKQVVDIVLSNSGRGEA